MKRFLPGIILILMCFASCDSAKVFEENYDFEENSWYLDTIPVFEFEIEDLEEKNVIVNLRNSASYPYQNIYLSYNLLDSNSKVLESKLIDISLFDEKTGKPFGSGSSVFAHEQNLLEGFR